MMCAMHRAWVRALVAASVAGLLVAASVWAWRRFAADGLSVLWTVVPGVLAVVVLLAPWVRAARAGHSEHVLGDAADDLASRVAAQLSAAEGSAQMLTLPVRWATTDRAEAVMVGWAGIRGDPADSSPIELAGRFADIATVFARLSPPRRLVVVGPGGAGKSVLAARLVADLLERREPGGAVPVLLPLAAWDPQQRLQSWLADRLADVAPSLSSRTDRFDPASRRRPTVAQALINAALVVPVLDGFDEIPADLRAAALSGIARSLRRRDQVVFTSRPDEFDEAVALEGPLPGTAVVELIPLDPDDVERHLLATAGGLADRWRPVLDELRARPEAPLAQALSTPLMVWLAVTIYRGRRADPAELLDPAVAGSRTAAEQHLLDGLIPAVYSGGGRRSRWTAARGRRWLGFLAARLTAARSSALSWRSLAGSVPHWAATTLGAVVGAVAGAVLDGLPGLLAGAATGAVVGTARRGGVRQVLITTAGALLLAYLGAVQAGLGRVGIGAAMVVLAAWLLWALNMRWQGSSRQIGLSVGRRTALWHSAVAGAVFGAAMQVLLPDGPAIAPVAGEAAGFGVMALAGATVWLFCFTAWGEWLLARWWLAATGRLPWALLAFLSDAQRRGVLRREGGIYEFRHARLQDSLAAAIPAQRRESRPAAPRLR
jgi:hypothetical protein